MKHLVVPMIAVLVLSGIVVAGCGQAAPAAQPTAAPAKAAEPTKAPAAQPTAAPAVQPTAAPAVPKVTYPEKGKPITIIVPWAAGSVNDVIARFLAGFMEKELNATIQVVAKPGAGSQTGITEVAKSKPDGYTLGMNSMPLTTMLYLDPDRQAAFSRKDLAPIAVLVADPVLLVVTSDSKYKTLQDLVNDAKANPYKIKVADSGVLTTGHAAWVGVGKAAGVRFSSVHFNGDSECYTALLGGHVDASIGYSSGVLPMVKSGKMRVLGTMDTQRAKYFPDIKTVPEQGFNATMVITRGFIAPGGTSPDMIEVIASAMGRLAKNDEFLKKAEEAAFPIQYLNTAQYTKLWDEQEAFIKNVLPDVKADAAGKQ